MIPIFDTHAHLDIRQFNADRAALIRRIESGTFPGGTAPDELDGMPIAMTGVLIPGIEPAAFPKLLETAKLSPLFHAALAIHPTNTARLTEAVWRNLTELVHRKDVVAVGETGLDQYWHDVPIDVQTAAFRRHIELSKETGKPILIHSRDAWDVTLPILRNEGTLNGVMHAFSGGPAEAEACVQCGLMVSFAGAVTYRNSKFSPLWEAARVVPEDRLLIETDSPFMTPHPLRGQLKRNEPTLAALVAHRLAELRGTSLQAIADITNRNAAKLLSLP